MRGLLAAMLGGLVGATRPSQTAGIPWHGRARRRSDRGLGARLVTVHWNSIRLLRREYGRYLLARRAELAAEHGAGLPRVRAIPVGPDGRFTGRQWTKFRKAQQREERATARAREIRAA